MVYDLAFLNSDWLKNLRTDLGIMASLFSAHAKCVHRKNILNQKRNFRKIGLRGGHTRYKRKKNRHLPQMKLKYQMKLMIFRLYMNFDELIFNHCAVTNTNKNC